MERDTTQNVAPKHQLSITDAVAIIVGIVIGAGIFRTPSLVAANTDSDSLFLFAWILGGGVSLIGALCYAELTTAFPNAGGDYHFIGRAYGKKLAFLFAWARMSVIQTGSIALLAYIFGDYFSQIHSLGEFSSVIYAALVVIVLTAINITGIRLGTGTQKLFTVAEVAGVLLIAAAGLIFAPEVIETAPPVMDASTSSGNFIGLAMVFVLLTFGGWNEAAYISAELKSGKKRMVQVLIVSLFIITAAYLLINIGFLRALGHSGIAQSDAVAVDLMRIVWGETGVWLIGIIVAVSALTSANATIFTGARTNYALGKDFRILSFLGRWNSQTSGPVNALLVQGLIALVLISLGLFTRSGFETIIEYTAPVFWFFFLLVGIALFILRKKEPDVPRPFRVPLYPITPIIFCLTSAYLLYSSLMYTGVGALVGVVVLFVGVLLLAIFKKIEGRNKSKQSDEYHVDKIIT
ncbi:APC family permease [Albibacterium bauzanense]|uniref:Amino acid/polyamine/organocation transporter (APC superfamily) n=1 Tax=Albibacterium bauzanense TaxID=653929 RepID=A0A4R1M179_9SPHI|nr:amino acid permease [Albibacterium bauzanense]TCK84962.1 amino acid/polyamine/organocation transporter (APC superfamily) [Albibacterium bauzanense]